MRRRNFIVGAAMLPVTGATVVSGATARASATPTWSDHGGSDHGGIALPARNQEVSAARVREIAVAFHYVGADNLEAVMDKMVEARVGRSQIVASWQAISPKRGEHDWSVLDRYFAAAEARGLSTLVHINSTPDWVHPDLVETEPEYGKRIWYPPTRTADELAAFDHFVSTLVGRYRGRVESYEIWNEENWREFYQPIEDPVDYTKLLRTAYLAVKANDPGAAVMFGGTTRSAPGFLRKVYDAAAAYPDAAANRHFFDIMGAHPYTDDRHPDNPDPAKVREDESGGEFDDNFLGLDRMYAEMVRRGEGDKPIHLGEFSYTSVPTWFGEVPDDRRTHYIRRIYQLAAQRPYISGLAWFLWSESEKDDAFRGYTLLEYPDKPTRTYTGLTDLTHDVEHPTLRLSHRSRAIAATSPDLRAPLEKAELYAEGILVAEGTSLPLRWKPDDSLNGSTKLVQLVLYTRDGRTLSATPRFVSFGAQVIQLSHPTIRAGWNNRVEVGVGRTRKVTLRVLDSDGRVVSSLPLGSGTGTRRRLDAMIRVDRAGRYRVVATDHRGRAVAAPASLTVE